MFPNWDPKFACSQQPGCSLARCPPTALARIRTRCGTRSLPADGGCGKWTRGRSWAPGGKLTGQRASFATPLELKIGPLQFFPDGMRRFCRKTHDRIVLDDVCDLQMNPPKAAAEFNACACACRACACRACACRACACRIHGPAASGVQLLPMPRWPRQTAGKYDCLVQFGSTLLHCASIDDAARTSGLLVNLHLHCRNSLKICFLPFG